MVVQVEVEGSNPGVTPQQSINAANQPCTVIGVLSGKKQERRGAGIDGLLYLLQKLNISHASL